ncbi:MAG: DUF4179 domain-containing protein [Acutalibacter sp.]|nr:DUF4179 domain-containing protein [Acutalibacter sp.]
MKFAVDNEYEANKIRESLELSAVPDIIDKKLRQVYAELPEEVPVKKHSQMGRVWKTAAATVSSLAAAFLLLLGLNGLNPALAENLPLVGSIFQFVNRGYSPTVNMKLASSRISEYAVDVSEEEGSTVVVPAGSVFERAITAQLREVYYDGSFVLAGLEFQLNVDDDWITEIFQSKYDVIINGEPQIRHNEKGQVEYPHGTGNGFCDLSDYFLTKLGDGTYGMLKGFRVPDHLQGADSLEVELSFDGFSGNGIPVNSSGFTLPFTVQKREIPTKEIDCEGMEINGIRLLSATSNPVVTYLELEYPETYNNPASGAGFDDGIAIGFFGGEESLPMNGIVRDMNVMAGLSESETRSVVWSLFDKNGSHKHEAVFVVDFVNGTARIGSEEDLKRAPSADYACGVEAIQNLQDGYLVEKYRAEQEKPMLYLASGSGKREDLWVEVWQDGTLVDSRQIHWNDNGWSDNFLYFEYEDDGSILDRVPGTEHTVYMMILLNGYAGLDLTHPLTVKVYDSARELVLDQEITLEVNQN